MLIAIQGEAGSFHAQAAAVLHQAPIELMPCETFRSVFDAVEVGTAEKGVVAVENSLYGSLHETYDLLVTRKLPIIGEVSLPIHQQLIAFPGTSPTDITEIYSHPAALDQCREHLENTYPHAERIEYFDTAAAVKHIKNTQLKTAAAIASTSAAELYAMEIIDANIEDEAENITRFVAIQRTPLVIHRATKASLILITPHVPGALHKALGIFAEHACNLTKLESRPIRGEPFNYQFLVDVMADQDTLISVITELEQQNCRVTLLGHYKAA